MAQRWATEQLPALVGSKETCDLLGVARTTLHRWMQPGSGTHGPERTYMIEWKSIASGPVWDRLDVLDFAATDPRQRRKPEPR